MAARVLATGDDTSNSSSRRLIVLALIETSAYLGSLQKSEGAKGEFKGAVGSRHPLISSPGIPVEVLSKPKGPWYFHSIIVAQAGNQISSENKGEYWTSKNGTLKQSGSNNILKP